MDLRELTTHAEFRACEAVQRTVWGEPTPEVSAALLRAAQHAGALVAGASKGGALVGFVYSFPSFVDGRVGHHSHLLAVLPGARGSGVGRALKWFQRAWCLEHGINRVTWTFDPLRAKNAKLNLEHLGASVRHYLPDFYGPLGTLLNGDLPSDRLLAEWPLEAEYVGALARGTARPEPQRPTAVRLENQNGEPRFYPEVLEERMWLELPPAIAPETDPEHALRWRLTLREAIAAPLAAGYRATRFVAGGYVLERSTRDRNGSQRSTRTSR